MHEMKNPARNVRIRGEIVDSIPREETADRRVRVVVIKINEEDGTDGEIEKTEFVDFRGTAAKAEAHAVNQVARSIQQRFTNNAKSLQQNTLPLNRKDMRA